MAKSPHWYQENAYGFWDTVLHGWLPCSVREREKREEMKGGEMLPPTSCHLIERPTIRCLTPFEATVTMQHQANHSMTSLMVWCGEVRLPTLWFAEHRHMCAWMAAPAGQ